MAAVYQDKTPSYLRIERPFESNVHPDLEALLEVYTCIKPYSYELPV